jgi:hypothetical protein
MVNAKAARAVVGGGGCGEKGRQWERVQEVSVCVCGPEVQFSVGDPATAPTVAAQPIHAACVERSRSNYESSDWKSCIE